MHTVSTLTRDGASLLCKRVGSVATVAGKQISNEERQVRKRVTVSTIDASNLVVSLTNARSLISH